MNWLKGVLSTVGGFLLGLLGNVFVPVIVLISCQIIDYFTGVTASVYKGGLSAFSSKRGFRGIAKKICMLLLVAIGLMLDLLIAYYGEKIGVSFASSGVISLIVTLWLIFSEMTSILENLAACSVPIPAFLTKIVKALRKKTEDTGNGMLVTEEKEDKKNE